MDGESDNEMDLIHAFLAVQHFLCAINYACALYVVVMHAALQPLQRSVERLLEVERSPHPFQTQMDNLNRLLRNDVKCHEQLQLDIHTFNRLCSLVRGVGLSDSKYVVLEEKVAMFLWTIAHHKKNHVIKHDFLRSGQTVSKYFNEVFKAILKLQDVLLKRPETVSANCNDERWKWFQNCLGALDGTYVDVRVAEIDKPRYRTRKGEVATNVLGVCAPDTQFIYMLSRWEGSASDSRVLRDAISRPNGLKVPTGHYYLVDARYANGEGFLAPYRGNRYHLSNFRDGRTPTTPTELLNVKHASTRNVVERAFGILKSRWAILRSHSYFPIKTQCWIITACCLLHNLIKREMPHDPIEAAYDAQPPPPQPNDDEHDYIEVVEPSNQWNE